MHYWLLKTEPSTYCYDQLQKEKSTHWNGVRNFQARNFLKQIKRGDLALVYHSGDDKAVVGVARVTQESYPDPDPEKPGDWVQIDLEAVRPLSRAVGLTELKSEPSLKNLILIKQSRLSVMPVSKMEYEQILKMEKASPRKSK